ncbi:Gfo/Idh/MocA family oxidoreductase [Arthrobacter sp. SPG23]|uniref:Gfo/Idh/MocA family oxidoreductase n=1 Tax=Arthrobacter sp. SPG23 TaxID=1610703 RepID=UPI000697E59E|nr:Gfo/Idh/MocA family oxidoreductase [Arthrobacter sp. SPG23]
MPLYLDAGRTDSGFFVTIVHRNGVKSHVSATKSNRLVAREMRLLGSDGSYVSQQSDVQAVAAIAGRRPADDPAAWGYEDESRWGTLTTAAGQFRVPSEQGAYQAYYEQFALAVAGKGPEPVPGTEGVHTLEVLDAARLSDAERRSVDIEG